MTSTPASKPDCARSAIPSCENWQWPWQRTHIRLEGAILPEEWKEVYWERSHTGPIKPLDRLNAVDKLGRDLGTGDKAANDSMNALTEAVIAIGRKGSSAPLDAD
ncbi:MAG: hypothetical protein V4747_20310 [Pseudomonadota bacterium]